MLFALVFIMVFTLVFTLLFNLMVFAPMVFSRLTCVFWPYPQAFGATRPAQK